MVRVTRFSFDDGMNVDDSALRDDFDDEDFDEPTADERSAPKAAPARRRERPRHQPDDRRPDRRQMAGGDWETKARSNGESGEDCDATVEDRG